MKKIIAFLVTLILVFSVTCLPVFAETVHDYYDTNLKIEIETKTLEYNRSVKFVIDYPENNGNHSVELDKKVYENIYITLLDVSDTNGLLDFSYFFDDTLEKYEGHFIPVKSGETKIVATFEVRGYLNGEDVRVSGEQWQFSVSTDTLTVDEIDVESGYFENSSEETFDTSSYYAQLYQSQMVASEQEMSEQNNPNDSAKSSVGIIILIIAFVLLVLILAFLLIRNYNIKKYKKRK